MRCVREYLNLGQVMLELKSIVLLSGMQRNHKGESFFHRLIGFDDLLFHLCNMKS